MVRRCPECKVRTHRDGGSCNTKDCGYYRNPRRGGPGLNHELKSTLGKDLTCHVADWVGGGFILSSLHRHDIRVGIASGMYIRQQWPIVAAPLRLEILCVLSLSNWRWTTKKLLELLEPRVLEYARSQPLARAQIWREVWDAMEFEMDDRYVVTLHAPQAKLKLVSQWQLRQLYREGSFRDARGNSRGNYSSWNVLVNQWSRRHASKEFFILQKSLRDGSLWRACHQLAAKFEGCRQASYSAVSGAMNDNGVALWMTNRCSCARCAQVQAVNRCFL